MTFLMIRLLCWSGYFIIRGVMDAEWLAQANTAVDVQLGRPNAFNEFNSGGN